MTLSETRTGAASSAKAIKRRAAARLVDSILVAGVAIPLGLATDFGPAWFAGTLLGSAVWFIGGDMTGATVGKRLLGLVVSDVATLARPTLRQSVLREVLVLAGAIPFVGPVIAAAGWAAVVVTARGDEDGRGWHDRLAGTVVIDRSTSAEVG